MINYMIDSEARAELSENAKYLYPQINAMKNKLALKADPVIIAVQGDSTGNNTNEWFYLFGQWLASKYPECTVKHVLWNDTIQSYDSSTDIQIGSNGRGYARYSNENIDHIAIADHARLHITGDIELRIHCNCDSWVSAAAQVLVDKLGSGDSRSYSLYLTTDGKLRFYWSPNGTAAGLKGLISTVPIPATNGTDLYIKCTVDVDNGAGGHTVKFYTSTDNITWTQLGADLVGAGTTTLASNTSTLTFGYGSLGKFYGKIYSSEIRSGINGAVVASLDCGMLSPMNIGLSAYDLQGNAISREGYSGGISWGSGSPTIIMLNGSVSGAQLSYSTDVTRFALQHAVEADMNFISYSHNEGSTSDYRSAYLAYCDQLVAKWPSMAIVPVAQNPQTTPALNYLYHNRRCKQIAQLAAVRKYLCIDVNSKMVESGKVLDFVNQTDGVHPTDPGSIFWRDCVIYPFALIM